MKRRGGKKEEEADCVGDDEGNVQAGDGEGSDGAGDG